METAISPIDIPLLPTPSTSSASPSVELRHDYEVLSSNATDLSSAHTSPDDVRNPQPGECVADSLRAPARKQARSCPVVYESQISPELEGIKLKIKKSPTQDVPQTAGPAKKARVVRPRAPRARKPASAQGLGPKGRKRRRKKKGGQSDEGSGDEERDERGTAEYNGVASEEEAGDEQSVWASERMPPEILSRIFMEVTYTEGCVPTLVR